MRCYDPKTSQNDGSERGKEPQSESVVAMRQNDADLYDA